MTTLCKQCKGTGKTTEEVVKVQLPQRIKNGTIEVECPRCQGLGTY